MVRKRIRNRIMSMALVGIMAISLLDGCGWKAKETGANQPIVTVIDSEEDGAVVADVTDSITDNQEEDTNVFVDVAAKEEFVPEETAVETDKDVKKITNLVSVEKSVEEKQDKVAPEQKEDVILSLVEQNKNNQSASNGDNAGTTETIRTDIPYDIADPEGFASSATKFSDNTILVKMKKGFDGVLTKSLQDAGIGALEELFAAENGVWYTATLYEGADITETMARVRECSNVVVAEYNFAYETTEYMFEEALQVNPQAVKQDYLKKANIKGAWKFLEDHQISAGGDSGVVVAVIDTGVDYNHIDLKANMWKNQGEIPDNGIDDDGNGYVDDYYGVDMTAGSGSGNDDHGHGTHVAGIIAASNNKEGIVGIAYNSKVMTVKAGDASGVFLQGNVAKAIIYAYEQGADVINMSFGGNACSVAVQDALAMAYRRCVLVAAAGNDGWWNEGALSRPCYPAALSYVLGVMSVDEYNNESAFTNYDVLIQTKQEYEVYAPGEHILSTLPNDRYAILSGTSMAAPVVAAQAALLRSYYTDRTTYPTKYIYGQIVGTADGEVHCIHGGHNVPHAVNLGNSLETLPRPNISVAEYTIFDSTEFVSDTAGITAEYMGNNNGDGIVDAGETIAVGFVLNNRWGMSKNTKVTVRAVSDNGVENPYVTVLNDTVDYGSVGTYGEQDCGKVYDGDTWTGWEHPFYLYIAPNCPNDYHIRLEVTITYENGLDENDHTVYSTVEDYLGDRLFFSVRRGTILPAVVKEDMTLTKDHLYILSNSMTILNGATVTVQPGTRIQFWGGEEEDSYAQKRIVYMKVEGRLVCEGTEEEPVELFPSDRYDKYVVKVYTANGGYAAMDYTNVTNPDLQINKITNCEFNQNYVRQIWDRWLYNGTVIDGTPNVVSVNVNEAEACAFYKLYSICVSGVSYKNCIFVDSYLHHNAYSYQNCVFYGNNTSWEPDPNRDNNSDVGLHLTATRDNISTISLADSFYDAATGTTYLLCDIGKRPVMGRDGMLPLEQLAELMGGALFSIDSYEEFRTILDTFDERVLLLGCYTDGEKVYNYNGSKVPETIPYNIKYGRTYSYYYTSQGDYIFFADSNYEYSNVRFIIEIPGDILITDILLDEYLVDLDMDSTHRIHARVTPQLADPSSLIYTSENEAVATVSAEGVVTPVGEGTTSIRVYSPDYAIYNFVTVNVKEKVALSALTASQKEMYLNLGDEEKIELCFAPLNTTERTVTYHSSDENVATVDALGRIKALNYGDAEITVCGANGLSTKLLVHVLIRTEDFTFADAVYNTSMQNAEDYFALKPVFTPADATQTELIWESSDPEVCFVDENGTLVKNASGSAVLRATVRGTTLSAYIKVNVYMDLEQNVVRKMYQYYSSTYALTEAGNLWRWGNSISLPTKLNLGVQIIDFVNVADGTYDLYVLGEDGKVFRFDIDATVVDGQFGGQLIELPLNNIVALDRSRDSYSFFALDQDGNVWVWGSNDYGRLGLSAGISSVPESAPRTMELGEIDGIVTLAGVGTYTCLLDRNGNVYRVSNESVEPTLIAQNVLKMVRDDDDGYIWLYKEDRVERVLDGYVEYYSSLETDYSLYVTGSYSYYIKDGCVYIRGRNAYGQLGIGSKESPFLEEPMIGITNAMKVFPFGTNIYISCADGRLFATGDGSMYQLGNGSTVSTEIPLEFALARKSETQFPDVKATNLTGYEGEASVDGVLTEKKLELTFATEVNAGNMYSDIVLTDQSGSNVVISKQIEANVLTLSIKGELQEDTIYTLIIPQNALRCVDIANSDSITVQFIYQPAEVETPVEEEKVEHEIVIDEEKLADRFVTNDDLQALWEQCRQTGVNGRFYCNAIINRICDDNLNHWLKVMAPECDEYRSIPLGQNYWGTTDVNIAEKGIMDFEDFQTLADLEVDQILTEMPENVWPMVTDAYLMIDQERVDVVGAQEVSFVVEFNRAMDTNIDLEVTFGSSYPYRDYTVSGAYVSDRKWVGDVKLTTLIESGYEYFSISNGKAADSSQKLYTDWGRFQFQIDNSSAQSMALQASAQDDGILLTWFQDDFDTLAGYNVYRSTEEDGYYTRINRTVIPADTKELLDDTIEPGVMYYYNFTVVKTDLTESEPSGKTSLRAKDTMAPNIYHSPVYNAFTGRNLIISAIVTDNIGINSATVYYRTVGAQEWKTAEMTNNNDKYSAVIASNEVTTEGLEYYIAAYDGVSFTYKASEAEPYLITVQVAIDDSAKGDVDGNGAIELKDAMMLLQAINDRINLDAEQFARADLDGNGILEAKEALRIIKYVNGTLTSVLY